MSGREPDSRRQQAAEGGGEPLEPLAAAVLARRKRRDAAAVVPIAGAVLLASPLVDVVAVDARVLGIPVSLLYVFGIWFALIAITALLARKLGGDGEG